MKRAVGIVVGVVVLVAAGWIAASWYTGKRVEQEVRQYITELNEQAGFGNISIEEYERGIFSSSARYRFEAGTLSLPLNLIRTGDVIQFNGDIQHGPLPWMRLSKGRLMPVLAATHTRLENSGPAAFWCAAASGDVPLEERSVIHYDGTLEFSTRFASLDLEGPDFDLTADGGTANGTVGEDGHFIDVSARFGDVRLHAAAQNGAPPADLHLTGVSLQANSTKGKFDLYPGSAQLLIDEIRLETVDEQGEPLDVVLNNYRITGTLGEDETHIHGNVAYELGQLNVAGVSLGELRLNFKFGNLEGATVQQLMQRYEEALPKIMEESAQAGINSEGALSPALENWLSGSLDALLPGNPTFGIDDFRWTLDNRESHFAVHIALQPPTDSKLPPLLASTQRLNAELVLSRPMAIELLTRLEELPGGVIYASPQQARQAAQASFDFAQSLAILAGYATLEGDNLTSRLQYAAGEARLNGREIPLAELIEQMTGSL